MVKRNILEIQHQSYSSILGTYFICEHCKYVDRSIFRAFSGHCCGKCKKSEDSGIIYFSSSVRYLLNLMQESYNSKYYISSDDVDTDIEKSTNSHYLSVVLFFTTLREVLLQKLLNELASINKIPNSIYKRLLLDNRLHSQKQNKLFPAMTDLKWEDAIKLANSKDEIDYTELNDFMKNIVDIRNEFLHQGMDYLINKELAEKCILNLSPLLNLYVRFHNDLVHPYYLNAGI